jgi:hypothetical protein
MAPRGAQWGQIRVSYPLLEPAPAAWPCSGTTGGRADAERRLCFGVMGPTRGNIIGAALLFLTLAVLIVVVVWVAIPPGGPPTLR